MRIIHREIKMRCGCLVDISFDPHDFDVVRGEDVDMEGMMLEPCGHHALKEGE